MVTVTGKFARSVMEKLNFEVQLEMDYKDNKVNGERLFYPEEIHTDWIRSSLKVGRQVINFMQSHPHTW